MATALEGVRVLEAAYFLAGPYVGTLLAALGAEVIKVEAPGIGDPTRAHAPFVGASGLKSTAQSPEDMSLSILKRAQGKKSITLNLKSERGKQLFLDLARQSDVVVENFQPGTMQRLGLDYASVRAANPGIIYCSVSGFGQTGPYREKLAFDQIIQAASGVMSLNGTPGTAHVRTGFAVADDVAPLFGALSVVSALRYRDRTGKGQHVDVAMLDCLTALLWEEHLDWLMAQDIPLQQGNSNPIVGPIDCYPTKDGSVFVVCVTDLHWQRLAAALELSSFAGDPRFATTTLRAKHRDVVNAAVKPWFASRTTAEAMAVMERHEVPAGPVRAVSEVLDDPQVKHRGVLSGLRHPLLDKPSVAIGASFPVKFSEMPSKPELPAPLLGMHNDEVFGSLLGLSKADLDDLHQAGVI